MAAIIDSDGHAFIEPAEIVRTLRYAAAGRREYADTATDDTRGLLLHEAWALECAATFIEKGDRVGYLRTMVPSWRWPMVGVSLGNGHAKTPPSPHTNGSDRPDGAA